MKEYEALHYLYYNIYIPIIFCVMRIIIGILLGFNNRKLKCFMQKTVYFYYGLICGGIIGYALNLELIYIVVCSVLGALILYGIERADKKKIVLHFITIFSGTYIVMNFLINLYKVDFEELLGTYGDLLVNYTNIHISLAVAGATGAITAIILLMKNIQFSDVFLKGFMGALFLVGSIFTGTESLFYMTGELEDFFIPLLNIHYYSDICIVATILLIIICVVMVKMSKKYEAERNL